MNNSLPAEAIDVLNRLKSRIRQYVLFEGLALVVVLLGTLAAGSVRMGDVERGGRGLATAAAQLRAFFTGRVEGDEQVQIELA